MHPAPSIILFTTLSGLGFGLLTFLGLGMPSSTGFTAFVFFTIAYLLAVGGLSASHVPPWPSRARAEGLQPMALQLAVARRHLRCCGPRRNGDYGIGRVFFAQTGPNRCIGAILSLLTVFTTSMIYAQLKTVPRWHMPLTSPLFMALSITGGALLAGQVQFVIPLLILSAVIQVAYWVVGDSRLAAVRQQRWRARQVWAISARSKRSSRRTPAPTI